MDNTGWSDDDSSWTTLYKVRGFCDQAPGTTDYTISAHKGIMAETAANKQAWRIVPTAAGGSVYAFSEIEFRASVCGSDQCVGGANFGSTYSGANSDFQSKAFDDNTSTYGATANKSGTQWFGYLFPSTVDVQQVALRSRSAGDASQSPTSFTIEYWDGTGRLGRYGRLSRALLPGR
jgi:hypothetical protein